MFLPLAVVLLSQFLFSVDAFYAKNGDVVELTDMKGPTKDAGVWLVEFYAPWCGHCVKAKPEVEKAASALKGIAKIGAVDMTAHQALGGPYGVQGFPTFKIFANGQVSDYNGERTAAGFVNAVTSAISSLAKSKLNGGKKSSDNSKKSNDKKDSKSSSNEAVQKITDDNFESMVMNSNDMWLVAFVADYCGHCKALKPAYFGAAKKFVGTGVKFATVEAPENNALSQRFGIKGFPTIKVFGPGKKSDSSAKTYEGPRDEEAIVAYATEQFEKMGGSFEVDIPEVVDSAVFDKVCKKEKKCILVVVEDLLDTTAAKRTKDLEVVKKVAKGARHMPFGWMAANAQPKFEAAFELTFGFPAVIMLREGPGGEKVGFVHRGKFVAEDIAKFVMATRSLSSGTIVPNWPELVKTEAWDGKSEAKKIVEEKDDFNLDDFLSEL